MSGQDDDIKEALRGVERALDAVADREDAARTEALTNRRLLRVYRDEQLETKGRVTALEVQADGLQGQIGAPEPLRGIATGNRDKIMRWSAVGAAALIAVGLALNAAKCW